MDVFYQDLYESVQPQGEGGCIGSFAVRLRMVNLLVLRLGLTLSSVLFSPFKNGSRDLSITRAVETYFETGRLNGPVDDLLLQLRIVHLVMRKADVTYEDLRAQEDERVSVHETIAKRLCEMLKGTASDRKTVLQDEEMILRRDYVPRRYLRERLEVLEKTSWDLFREINRLCAVDGLRGTTDLSDYLDNLQHDPAAEDACLSSIDQLHVAAVKELYRRLEWPHRVHAVLKSLYRKIMNLEEEDPIHGQNVLELQQQYLRSVGGYNNVCKLINKYKMYKM